MFNSWYKYAWKSMTYGGFIAFFIPFFFWCLSFAEKNIFAYLYVAILVLFAGIYGGYVTATTIIFQFQAIKDYATGDDLELSDIWWFFGGYLATQLFASWIGQHYMLDSIFYLLASNIKDWCEDHPGVC